MKIFCLFLLVSSSVALPSKPVLDLDPNDSLGEKEFEKKFNKEEKENFDEEEYEKRKEALKENEAMVKKENEEFEEGKIEWYEKINEDSDLPKDEFEKEKTGLIMPEEYGRGLLEPLPEFRVDEDSERYFETVRSLNRAVPSSYSSVAKGDVSSVKSQGKCGSCAAFASMAAIETCFKRVTGVFGDYAEQQFVDGAYGYEGAKGCDGAAPHAYLKWAAKKNPLRNQGSGFPHENMRPYANTEPSYGSMTQQTYNQGAKITDVYYKYDSDEDLLQKMVAENGAVVTGVSAYGPFQQYAGGIFAGCPSGAKVDHAVTVVGYGSENGEKYWLIKNSWGEDWGEKGFIRLKRGVGMCGVGGTIVVTKCGPNGSTSTDAPLTTPKPCIDKYTNCPQMTKYCTDPNNPQIAAGCQKACGLCGGGPTQAPWCADDYTNCPQLAAFCNDSFNPQIGTGCKKTCGKC